MIYFYLGLHAYDILTLQKKPQKKIFHKVILEEMLTWTKNNNEPIPKKELFKRLINKDISESTIRHGITALLKQGYIRRAAIVSNQSFYILIRTKIEL